MPRLNNGLEIFSRLTSIRKYALQSGTAGDTTLATAAAALDTDLDVAAATNFADGDPCFLIGDGGVELVEIDGTPATTMPLRQPLQIAQGAGAQLVEAAEIGLGHITEEGIRYGASRQLQEILSAVAQGAIGYYFNAGAQLQLSFSLRGWNNLNFQAVHGIDEVETGAGTEADPYTAAVTTLNVGTHGTQCFRALGVRFDGKIVQMDFLDARTEVAVDTPIGGQQPAVMPITLKCSGLIQRIWS